MTESIFLKLGDSLIAGKRSPSTPRLPKLERLPMRSLRCSPLVPSAENRWIRGWETASTLGMSKGPGTAPSWAH